MAIQFEIELRIGLVFLTCYGGFTMGSLLDAFDKGLDRAESENLRAVLVDAREVKGIPPTLMQHYDIGTIVPIMQSPFTAYRSRIYWKCSSGGPS